MSAQGGVFYFDERPVDPRLAERIDIALTALGPDGGGVVTLPGLAMAYRALHVTPEDQFEHQPFRSRLGHVLSWDGRLDNRDDLLLQLDRRLDDDRSDAALAMAAYEQWGDDGFGRMIGDWSLALWDSTARELKLASDYAGTRALYYREDSECVHWSTSLGELVDRLALHDALEPRFIVGYLTFSSPPDRTPYRNIRPVPTSRVLSWAVGGRKREARFWDLAIDSVRYRDPRDYDVALRALLGDAVKARLRSTRTVWAELSGGFDSSTVACLADRLIRLGVADAPALETLSYISESSPESDERPFILAVQSERGRRGHHLTAEACFESVDDDRGWVTPMHPHGVSIEFFKTVRQRGGRVLLSGHPGDLVMSNYPETVAGAGQHLAERRLGSFLSSARAWSRASRQPIWHIVPRLVEPYLSKRASAERVTLQLLHRNGATAGDVMTAASEAYLLTRRSCDTWWQERLRRASGTAAYGHRWQHTLIDGVLEFVDQRTFQSPPDFAGVVHTHPYTDRRLVSFVLAIPPDILNPPGQPRRLMKESIGFVLPPKVLRRFSKGYVDPLKLRKVRTWSPAVLARLDSLYVVREGFIDREALRAKLQATSDGSCRSLGNIEAVLKFERWMALFEAARRPASAADGVRSLA